MLATVRNRIKRLLRRRINFGDLAGTSPLSPHFGFERGTPIDRYYIQSFLHENRAAIRGAALEVGDDSYITRFGEDRLSSKDVLHIDPSCPTATIIGDLAVGSTLPRRRFDCAVITQTLHLIYDMRAAVQNLHDSLKPGGTLLLTSPGITQIARDQWKSTWYWSLTPAGAQRLFTEVFGDDCVSVDFHGNVFAAIAFLTGVAAEEVSARKLEWRDEAYPVLVTVRATRAPE